MFNGGVEMLSLNMSRSTDELRCQDGIVVHEMFNGGVEMLSLFIRCSTDELRCYRCILDFQPRSQDAIIVHEMFNEGVETLSVMRVDVVWLDEDWSIWAGLVLEGVVGWISLVLEGVKLEPENMDGIIPVKNKIVDPKTRDETHVTISVDDGIRPGTTLVDLANLKLVFKKDE
ncbi:hypothetical protein Tco_1150161 [Tanacetum coccineum]